MLTRGRVRVTLRPHADVDDLGFVTRSGVGHVWAAVACGVPDGVELIVELGPVRHVNQQVIDLCVEHLGPRQAVVFESQDSAVAMAWARAGFEATR